MKPQNLSIITQVGHDIEAKTCVLACLCHRKLPVPVQSVHPCIKTLFKRYTTEKCTEVRALIVRLVGDLCLTVGYDFTQVLRDIVELLEKECKSLLPFACFVCVFVVCLHVFVIC